MESPTLSVSQMLALRRRRTNPYEDWIGDGTRMIAWIQDAVSLAATLSGRTRQEVLRDALLGEAPLPAEILDDAFRDRYGHTRPRQMPR